jgi:hypothetical protein
MLLGIFSHFFSNYSPPIFLQSQLRTLYSPADIEAAYSHYVDVVMRRCLQRRPHALSLVAVDRQSARVCGVLINDMLQVCGDPWEFLVSFMSA